MLERWKVSFNQKKHYQEVAPEWRRFVERLGTGWEAVRIARCSDTVRDGVLGSEWSCQLWLDLAIVPGKPVLAPSKR